MCPRRRRRGRWPAGPSSGHSCPARSSPRSTGLDGVREACDAEPGDRTMIDALAPAAATFSDRLDAGHPWPEALNAAVEAATAGADATADLPPRLGRAGHLGLRVLGCPDPGAQAVAVWLRAAAAAIIP
ncbi:DAK2 domain-containing protein [Actinoplanes sp. NPDC024001]|uniref:DAK2 domain-containing protein n=1 Tax=Actinoplanes sp. NPDC024001 TaxID=3154598 RepID=UPI0033E83D75